MGHSLVHPKPSCNLWLSFSGFGSNFGSVRQNLWRVTKLPNVPAKFIIRVNFVCPSCVHPLDTMSARVTFAFTSCAYRWYRALFFARGQYDGHTELPNGVWKTTRHCQTLANSSCSHRMTLCDTKIVSRWHHGTSKDRKVAYNITWTYNGSFGATEQTNVCLTIQKKTKKKKTQQTLKLFRWECFIPLF